MVKHLKDGQDFFDHAHHGDLSDFGFYGSLKGGAEHHAHGGKHHYAEGGPVMPGSQQMVPPGRAPAPLETATISMPATQAAKAAQSLVAIGRQQGATQAVHDLASQARARRGNPAEAMMPAQAALSQAAQPPRPVEQARVPAAAMAPGAAAPAEGAMPSTALKKGGKFIQGAIKHEGRETARAKASGRSVHEQMVHDSHSADPSLRGAANLGLRLTGGDLRPKGRRHDKE